MVELLYEILGSSCVAVLSISELNIESTRCMDSADRCAVMSSTMLRIGFTLEFSSVPCCTLESVAGFSMPAGAE
jgi:hypothetical protein